MTRKRTRKPKLPRLLENSTSLVAVVADDYEIAYANTACADWLEIPTEELIGRKLSFSASDVSNHSAANGICPTPDCFDSRSPACSSHFISANKNDQSVWKPAAFNRVYDSDGFAYILIIADGPDLAVPHNDHRVDAHVELQRLFSEIRKQVRSYPTMDHLIGASDEMNRLRRQIKAIAANQEDCLIVGPIGSGREHVARTIFHCRNLAPANLIPIHCSITDSQLLQKSIKEWIVEQRENRSTDWLLLLGVDQMNLESQVELFGYTQIPDFPLRIIATAQNDLLWLASEEQFHQSLANYLCIQKIELTALSKRKSDIPLLCQHFIESKNKNAGRQISGVSDATLELFFEYHWPENIDELKRVIHEAYDICDQTRITPQHLGDSFRHALSASRIGYHKTEEIQLDEYLAEIEKELIHRALLESQNNKTKAAQILGINRAKLLRRASALGLIELESQANNNQIDSSAFKEAES